MEVNKNLGITRQINPSKSLRSYKGHELSGCLGSGMGFAGSWTLTMEHTRTLYINNFLIYVEKFEKFTL